MRVYVLEVTVCQFIQLNITIDVHAVQFRLGDGTNDIEKRKQNQHQTHEIANFHGNFYVETYMKNKYSCPVHLTMVFVLFMGF